VNYSREIQKTGWTEMESAQRVISFGKEKKKRLLRNFSGLGDWLSSFLFPDRLFLGQETRTLENFHSALTSECSYYLPKLI
jgi:hypothetical protein